MKWYAYRNVSGAIVLEGYLSEEEMVKARASSYVEEVYGPVEANSREEARKKIQRKINESCPTKK